MSLGEPGVHAGWMEDVSAGQRSDRVALLEAVHADSTQRARVLWAGGDGISAFFVGIWMLRGHSRPICPSVSGRFAEWSPGVLSSRCPIESFVLGIIQHRLVAFANLFRIGFVLVATHPPGGIVYQREQLLDFTPGDDPDEPSRPYQALGVYGIDALALTDIAMPGAHDRPIGVDQMVRHGTPAALRDSQPTRSK